MLSPGKVYYGHNTDIYVIDSTLVPKYTWNKCEISTVYSWNRFNLTTTYKWNRYTVEQEAVSRYAVEDTGDTHAFVTPFGGARWTSSFASSYNFSRTSSVLTFSGVKTISRSSNDTSANYVSRLKSGGAVGSYFTNISYDHSGASNSFESITVETIRLNSDWRDTFYKIQDVYIVGAGPNSGELCIDVDVYEFVRDGTITENVQGDYIDQVTSSSSSTYPGNGQSGSYWYVSAGSTTSKGSANGSVTSTNASAYPADGASGSYWYTSSGSTQQAGSVIGVVESYDSSAYPDNGILDGYWYVKQ